MRYLPISGPHQVIAEQLVLFRRQGVGIFIIDASREHATLPSLSSNGRSSIIGGFHSLPVHFAPFIFLPLSERFAAKIISRYTDNQFKPLNMPFGNPCN